MSGPRGERCDKCYFGKEQDPNEPDLPLWCHRYPPTRPFVEDNRRPDIVDPDEPWQLTTVWRSGWCGEFRPRDDEA